MSLNGARVAEARFDGLRVKSIEQPLAEIVDGSNRIDIEVPRDHGYQFDIVQLDRVTLTYPRRFKARDSGHSLVFRSSWNKFQVYNLASPQVTVYRQSVSGEVSEMTARESSQCHGGEIGCLVRFAGEDETPNSIYFVSTEDGLKTPQIRIAPPAEELFDGQARYLIVAHPDFIDTPSQLLESYEAELSALYDSADIVSVESIYAQYSGQVVDAAAIHRYIIDAVRQRGSEHVLLVGGDVYDYHDNLGSEAKSFIPSLYVQTGMNQNTVPSDAKYADIDGDDVPDVGISRLPVRTEMELEAILSKRQAYLQRSYRGRAMFSADEVDGSGYSFKADSESVINAYFDGWQISRAYLDDLGSGANQVLKAGIDSGMSLTAYTGHSSTDRWSLSDLLSSEDVANLSNTGKPTVVVQWGCWNTFYVSPHEESLADRFLLEGEQGAVTVMGATSFASADSEKVMAELLYERLKQGMPIGEAVLSAKRAFAQNHPGSLDILLGWAVLGPADLIVYDPQ